MTKNKLIVAGVWLVMLAFAAPSMGAAYLSGPNYSGRNIFSYKPGDLIFPGFVQDEYQQRVDGYGDFISFLDDVRTFIRSAVGAPLTNRRQSQSRAREEVENEATTGAFEPSFPIVVGQNTGTEDVIELYLGFRIGEVLERIFWLGTRNGGGRTNRAGRSTRSSGRLFSVSPGGTSLRSGGSWIGGSFLSTGNSGFGYNLEPIRYPGNTGEFQSYDDRVVDPEESKGALALRKQVLDLFINPYVFFGILIVSAFIMVSRFRNVSV